MSLLSRQVYANPTTPLWAPAGSGGGGGSNPIYNSVTVAPGGGGPLPVKFGLNGAAAVGIFQLDEDGMPAADYLSFSGSNMDLSNVSSINGVPYFNSPGTQFDFQAQGGTALAEAPDVTVLNALSFTAPANGKLYMEAMGNFISTTQFGGLGLGLAVGGTTISNSLTFANAYDSNINLPAVSMYQIPVTGGAVYDISAIAFCSALPPAGSDMVVQTSRLFLMFSPQ